MNNRWVQLGAALVAMLMIANLQYSWTLFVKPIQDSTGWKLSDIQWAFTLFILFQTWVMPLEGWLIDRLGARFFVSLAGLLCGAGWAAMGSATTPRQLYVAYVLAGVGAAFVYSGSMSAAMKWFAQQRGLAAGIIAAGFGSGTALFVPVIALLLRDYGYQKTFLYTGIVQGLVILAVAQLMRKPEHAVVMGAGKAAAGSSRVRRSSEPFTTPEMLRTPQFYTLYAMFVSMATGGLLVTAQAGPVASEWNITREALTAALALNSLANGVSRIGWGWVSDRIGRETAMIIAFSLQAVCLLTVLWFGSRSGTLFAITLVLTFLTWGEIFALFPSIVADYYGPLHATSNYCFLYTAKGVASIIGGGVGALLFERFGSWSAVFYGSVALAMFSAVLAIGLRAGPLPQRRAEVLP
jgi:OFA family oxalate/formate antiporter-like MFS transporter